MSPSLHHLQDTSRLIYSHSHIGLSTCYTVRTPCLSTLDKNTYQNQTSMIL